MILLNLRFDARLSLGLLVAFSAFVGAAGCNTQSLVPQTDGGARTGSGGSTGVGNRSGGTAAETGTDSGAGGGVGTSGAGGTIGTRGVGGMRGGGGLPGITGAAGFRFPIGGMAGRRPSVTGDGGQPPAVDASTTTSTVDGGDCQCVVGADGVLRMSWDCFTANFGGGAPMSGWCGGSPGGWVSSCGLEVFKLNRDDSTIPDDEWVYDGSGNLVGQQIASVSPVFVCPTAPTLWPAATLVAAGRFPSNSCAVENCTCGDAGAINCPVPDPGILLFKSF